MRDLETVQRSLQFAAQLIARRPATEWAGWAVYLMAALEEDDRVAPASLHACFETVQEIVTRRLEEGSW